ncbi:hypothetical protein, partial [Escherichia coli]|uniref:hypothetical protein n=1 Tax=Escherichia coli TaxID=562 RepID=UPI001BC834F4
HCRVAFLSTLTRIWCLFLLFCSMCRTPPSPTPQPSSASSNVTKKQPIHIGEGVRFPRILKAEKTFFGGKLFILLIVFFFINIQKDMKLTIDKK